MNILRVKDAVFEAILGPYTMQIHSIIHTKFETFILQNPPNPDHKYQALDENAKFEIVK